MLNSESCSSVMSISSTRKGCHPKKSLSTMPLRWRLRGICVHSTSVTTRQPRLTFSRLTLQKPAERCQTKSPLPHLCGCHKTCIFSRYRTRKTDRQKMLTISRASVHPAESLRHTHIRWSCPIRSGNNQHLHRLTRAHREKQLKMSCQALHNAPPNRT